MHAAFVVIIAHGGAPVAPHHRALVDDAQPLGLAFTSRHHLSWRSDDGRVLLGAWQDEPAERTHDARRWLVDDRSVTATVGSIRVAGSPWGSEGTWAAVVHDVVGVTPGEATDGAQRVRRVAQALRGVHAYACLADDGSGIVAADPMGFRFLYVAERPDVTVVATRAALAAAAVADVHSAPTRDPLGVLWSAYAGQPIGLRTGFEGVRLLAPGEQVALVPGSAAMLERPRLPWEPDADMASLSEAELVDIARQELADELRAAPSLVGLLGGAHDEPARVDLTGGKDSRLLLGVAVGEGLAQQFLYQTVGPRRLADVVVASSLAAHYGLAHENPLSLGSHRLDYAERFAWFVNGAGGMRNAWLLKAPLERAARTRVSGQDGLVIRSKQRVAESITTQADLEVWMDRFTHDTLGVVDPDAARVLRGELASELDRASPSATGIADRLDLAVQTNTSRHMVGLLEELEDDRRGLPFTSARLAQVGWALGGEARRHEVVFAQILGTAAPWLLDQPLAGGSWNFHGPGHPRPMPLAELGFAAKPARRARPESAERDSFGSWLHRAGADRRLEVLHDVLTAADNPVWAVVDRERTRAALDDYEVLTALARKQLFGVATAACWLVGEDA